MVEDLLDGKTFGNHKSIGGSGGCGLSDLIGSIPRRGLAELSKRSGGDPILVVEIDGLPVSNRFDRGSPLGIGRIIAPILIGLFDLKLSD